MNRTAEEQQYWTALAIECSAENGRKHGNLKTTVYVLAVWAGSAEKVYLPGWWLLLSNQLLTELGLDVTLDNQLVVYHFGVFPSDSDQAMRLF